MSITSINGAARSRRLSLWIAALTALLVTQITACGGGGGSSNPLDAILGGLTRR